MRKEVIIPQALYPQTAIDRPLIRTLSDHQEAVDNALDTLTDKLFINKFDKC